MKNAYFKFACIFIIAMFCLTPLSAIDLNQNDNNTKYINQDDKENNIFIDDENTTDVDVKDDVSEIDSNDVDDNNSADAKELKTITANDSALTVKDDANSSKTQLSKSCPNLRASISDIEYGEAPVVNVYSEKKLHARIAMESSAFELPYKVAIQDGNLRYQFHEDNLEPGTYEVKISTIGDKNYDPQEITASFTVRKISPKFIVPKPENIGYGEKAVINVLADERFNETATLRLLEQEGRVPEKTVPIKFTNGNASVAVENLTPGYYRAIVEYEGNNHFSADGNENCFIAYGNADSNLRVEVDDIQYGEHPVVKVYSNESYNGIIEIQNLNTKKTYRSQIDDGYFEYELPEDLNMGVYVLYVKGDGDPIFAPTTGIPAVFSVKKADPNLRIHVDDSYVNETTYNNQEVHVVVDARENFNGNATITLNNRVYYKKIEIVNGHGEGIYCGGDFPGNYTAKAETEGNNHFFAGNCSSTYEVKKV